MGTPSRRTGPGRGSRCLPAWYCRRPPRTPRRHPPSPRPPATPDASPASSLCKGAGLLPVRTHGGLLLDALEGQEHAILAFERIRPLAFLEGDRHPERVPVQGVDHAHLLLLL